MVSVIKAIIDRIQQRKIIQNRFSTLRSKFSKSQILSCDIDAMSSVGDYSLIHSGSSMWHSIIGNFSYLGSGSHIRNAKIGNFSSIGPNVEIGFNTHPSSVFVSTYPAFYSFDNKSCPVAFTKSRTFDDSIPETRIGHDVWIGANVLIMGGVEVGTGAIIAAGSVVVKDVPPYAIVGGNPAKLIRLRFNEGIINDLLKTNWWNWDKETLIQNCDRFQNVELFTEWMKNHKK